MNRSQFLWRFSEKPFFRHEQNPYELPPLEVPSHDFHIISGVHPLGVHMHITCGKFVHFLQSFKSSAHSRRHCPLTMRICSLVEVMKKQNVIELSYSSSGKRMNRDASLWIIGDLTSQKRSLFLQKVKEDSFSTDEDYGADSKLQLNFSMHDCVVPVTIRKETPVRLKSRRKGSFRSYKMAGRMMV